MRHYYQNYLDYTQWVDINIYYPIHASKTVKDNSFYHISSTLNSHIKITLENNISANQLIKPITSRKQYKRRLDSPLSLGLKKFVGTLVGHCYARFVALALTNKYLTSCHFLSIFLLLLTTNTFLLDRNNLSTVKYYCY